MTSKPTICQVLHSLSVGGAEVLASKLTRSLGARYRFVFACLDGLGTIGEQLRGEGYCVELLQRRPGIDFGCFRRLARFWQQHEVALVHAYQYTPFFYSMAARGFHSRPRILLNEHGRFFPDYRRWKRVVFNRLCLRRTDRVVAVGEWLRQTLVANEGIPAKRIEVIYNGISAEASPPKEDRAGLRKRIGVGGDEIVVVQVARLDTIKDHATRAPRMSRVAAVRSDMRARVGRRRHERTFIESEVNRLRLESIVRMLGNCSDVPSLLHASDLLLLTSLSEAIPVTIIEAMVAGLPVVSTDVGGVRELIEPGRERPLGGQGG